MKIIIIGCPGAGKSVLTRRLNEFLNYPVMHLDKVYHTGGKEHIGREALIKEINIFANKFTNWIIDGNYISTLEMRVKLAEMIILLNISSDICLKNAYDRECEYIKNGVTREDMAKGVDVSMNKEFANFIKNFEKDTLIKIKNILEVYKVGKKIKIINNYGELDEFVEKFKKYNNV